MYNICVSVNAKAGPQDDEGNGKQCGCLYNLIFSYALVFYNVSIFVVRREEDGGSLGLCKRMLMYKYFVILYTVKNRLFCMYLYNHIEMYLSPTCGVVSPILLGLNLDHIGGSCRMAASTVGG